MQIVKGAWRQERARQVEVVGGEAIPRENPGKHLLALLQGALIRALCLQANPNLLCLRSHLKILDSRVEGVREVGVAHPGVALCGPSA